MYFPSNPVFPVPNTYPRIYPRFAVMSQRPPWKCSIFGGLYKQSKQIREGGREGERDNVRIEKEKPEGTTYAFWMGFF